MIEFFNQKEDKKPKLIQARSALLIFLAVIFAEFLVFSDYTGRISYDDLLAKISSVELVELTNVRREEKDLETLQIDYLTLE